MNAAPKKNLKEFNPFSISTEMIATHKAYTAQSNRLAHAVCWYLACYKDHISTDRFFNAINELYFNALSTEDIKYREPVDTLYVISYFLLLQKSQSDRLQHMSSNLKEIEFYKLLLISINLADKFLLDHASYLVEIFKCADPTFAKISFEELTNLEVSALKALNWKLQLKGDDNTLSTLFRKLSKLALLGPTQPSDTLKNLKEYAKMSEMEIYEQILREAHEAIDTLETLNPYPVPTTDDMDVQKSLQKKPVPILLQYRPRKETEKKEIKIKPKF